MNTDLFSVRRLRQFVCLLCTAAAAITPKAEAEYTFTLIADTAGAFSDFAPVPSPSLNAAGTVAFIAKLDTGRSGIFKGDGAATTTIALNPQSIGTYSYPSINQAGTVAFFEAQGNVGGIERILSGNGGPLTTIADIAGPFSSFVGGYSTSINSAGTVAFWALPDTGPAGIFAGSGGPVTPLFINSVSLSTGFRFAFNDAGTLAFRKSNATGIVTVSGGAATTIVDGSGTFNYFGSAPSLNDNDRVAFVAGKDGIDGGVFGIYTGNGGTLTTIADLSGPFSYLGDFDLYQPSINDSGMVAFSGALDAGGGGVFIGDGTVTRKVVGVGDALFGSIVTGAGVSLNSLNDSGQVAFYYELANGTAGIAVATPVPEPGSLSLLFGGLLAIFVPHRCRAQ